jgi:hypothetical protein
MHYTHPKSFKIPNLKSSLTKDAVGLGGSGGLDGKYVKNNKKQNPENPNAET